MGSSKSMLPLSVLATMIFLGCTQQSANDGDPQPTVTTTEESTSTQSSIAGNAASDSFFTVDHYDPKRDAVKDLEMTVAKATESNKRILIEVGGKW